MHRLLLLMLPLFCLNCGRNDGGISSEKKPELSLQKVSDTLIFSDGDKRYPYWYDYTTNLLIFRNRTDSLFEYYDLGTREFVKTHKVDAKYWDFVASSTDIFVLFSGSDVMFLYDSLYNRRGDLIVWDLENARVKRRFPITFNQETEHIYIRLNRQFQPYFDYENQKIYTHAINYENYENRKYKLDTEVIVEYDMLTGEKKMVPFKFPEIMSQITICGFQHDVYGCVRGDSMIISYSEIPNIDVYDVSDSMLYRHNVPHHGFDTLAGNSSDIQTNFDMCRQGWLTEFFFGPIKYNPAQDLFYRTYRDKMALMKPDSTYNTENDKPFGIQVLDAQFNILGDFPIGDMPRWEEVFELFPTKDGLLYSRIPGEGRDTIVLYHLNFKYE
ncbi:MAG: DUF4221 family protein [Bacteroidetes bacterium]|nr:DUF4221 family protein [Bacteroidota bacterium]